MTFYVENQTAIEMEFSYNEVASLVCEKALEVLECPYEVQVNILLTLKEEIRALNNTYRNIDKETDVLSFPNIEFDEVADFSKVEDNINDNFDPETGELILGDIIINLERVKSQAKEYNHSEKREFAFLIAHSMLHLCGYDHEEESEAKVMEELQNKILNLLKITRE